MIIFEFIILILILCVVTIIVIAPFALIAIFLQWVINPITIEDSDDVQ